MSKDRAISHGARDLMPIKAKSSLAESDISENGYVRDSIIDIAQNYQASKREIQQIKEGREVKSKAQMSKTLF